MNVVEFSSGRRTNMVPDYAIAIVETDKSKRKLTEAFEQFLKNIH